jgi:uncharacterized OB-fold protein
MSRICCLTGMEETMAIGDEEVLARYPGLLLDHDCKQLFKGFLERRLLIARCGDCGYYIHFPRAMCPKCWSRKVAPVQVSGRGSVYLLSFYHQGRGTAGAYGEPWPAAAIELEEQVRLRVTSTLVNCPRRDMRIGMAVKLAWMDWEGAPVPVFEPA